MPIFFSISARPCLFSELCTNCQSDQSTLAGGLPPSETFLGVGQPADLCFSSFPVLQKRASVVEVEVTDSLLLLLGEGRERDEEEEVFVELTQVPLGYSEREEEGFERREKKRGLSLFPRSTPGRGRI